MTDDLTGFDPATDVRLDATTLRALAHPLRVRLLGRLRLHGPATASHLAQDLGESSGATSYHLRQLEAYGLVAEDTERGTRRERWWRAVHRTTVFDMDLDDDTRAIGGEYLRAVAQAYSERLLQYADRLGTVADEHDTPWADAGTLSDWRFRFTAEQAVALKREMIELMQRHRSEAADAGEATFIAQVQLIPVSPTGTA